MSNNEEVQSAEGGSDGVMGMLKKFTKNKKMMYMAAVVVVCIVLFYLYSTDRLPFAKKSTNGNTAKNNKNGNKTATNNTASKNTTDTETIDELIDGINTQQTSNGL